MLASTLNYTRAGEEVNLSQPSVSVRIRQLETELGVKLFDQLGKRVVLTDAGQLLVPYANRVMAERITLSTSCRDWNVDR